MIPVVVTLLCRHFVAYNSDGVGFNFLAFGSPFCFCQNLNPVLVFLEREEELKLFTDEITLNMSMQIQIHQA